MPGRVRRWTVGKQTTGLVSRFVICEQPAHGSRRRGVDQRLSPWRGSVGWRGGRGSRRRPEVAVAGNKPVDRSATRSSMAVKQQATYIGGERPPAGLPGGGRRCRYRCRATCVQTQTASPRRSLTDLPNTPGCCHIPAHLPVGSGVGIAVGVEVGTGVGLPSERIRHSHRACEVSSRRHLCYIRCEWSRHCVLWPPTSRVGDGVWTPPFLPSLPGGGLARGEGRRGPCGLRRGGLGWYWSGAACGQGERKGQSETAINQQRHLQLPESTHWPVGAGEGGAVGLCSHRGRARHEAGQ